MAHLHRRVIKTKGFKQDLKRLETDIHRLNDFIKGAEEILSRTPELGRSTSNPDMLGLPMSELQDNPKVVLYYCYNKKEVIFLMLAKEGDPRPNAIVM